MFFNQEKILNFVNCVFWSFDMIIHFFLFCYHGELYQWIFKCETNFVIFLALKFLKIFYSEVIIDSHAVLRNNTVKSCVHLIQFFPMVTSCKTTVQHNQDIDIDRVVIQNRSISTKLPPLLFYGHVPFPPTSIPSLTTGNHYYVFHFFSHFTSVLELLFFSLTIIL